MMFSEYDDEELEQKTMLDEEEEEEEEEVDLDLFESESGPKEDFSEFSDIDDEENDEDIVDSSSDYDS